MKNYQQPFLRIQKILFSVINYIQFSESKMSEVEEELSPFLNNLSLSRQAVSLVDPFRDDPTAEDGIDPDIEFSDTSEEGFIRTFNLCYLCFQNHVQMMPIRGCCVPVLTVKKCQLCWSHSVARQHPGYVQN